MLSLDGPSELHVVTMVNHRTTRSATYGSIALLKPSPGHAPTLSKTRMKVRATDIGITSFDFTAISDTSQGGGGGGGGE